MPGDPLLEGGIFGHFVGQMPVNSALFRVVFRKQVVWLCGYHISPF